MADNNKNTSIQQFIPTTFEQIDAIAKRLAQSDLLPKALKGKPADVAIVIMTGLEFGIGVMTAIRGINVIEGRASMSADLMSGLVQGKPACEYFRLVKSTDALATYETKRRGHDQAVQLSYTIEQATRAGLTGKDNWKRHPAAMLRARCSSALCRAAYPDIVGGCYNEDEADEIREQKHNGTANIIDVSAVEGTPPQSSLEFDTLAQSIIERINTFFVIEEVKSLVPEIRTLPKDYQRRIKVVYDERVHGIQAGELVDPEPEPFAEQPPAEGPAAPDGNV
jgi:hypothetical protein